MSDRQLLAAALSERERRTRTRKIWRYYPDTGPLRRELYPKHQRFFDAGRSESVRVVIAANRVGKTEGMGGYELVLHLTGQYPEWWTGHRFDRGISAWAAGDTGKTVRDILQAKLLGATGELGTGLIPGDLIAGKPMAKAGIADAVEVVMIKHASGSVSRLTFKSYDQQREAFQGTEQDVILCDEEPPLDVWGECRMRTMSTGEAFEGGLLIGTFTPLRGKTKLIKHLRYAGTWELNVTWEDVPHLSEDAKAEILKDVPAHMRDARTKGVPTTGFGLIFDVPESQIVVAPITIPSHWPMMGGLDFGWDHPTAAAVLAFDRDTDTVYVCREHAARRTLPETFALALKRWGEWLPWAWPHDGHQDGGKFNVADQKQLHTIYRDAGLKTLPDHAQFANGSNSREAGILEMYQRMTDGRWKVFATCTQWLDEYRDYQRDESGRVIDEKDDVLSASRYAYMMRRFAKTKPTETTTRRHTARAVGDARIGY